MGGHKGYLSRGMHGEGTPGKGFIKMAKDGSTRSDFMDDVAFSISIGLHDGVPLKVIVDKRATSAARCWNTTAASARRRSKPRFGASKSSRPSLGGDRAQNWAHAIEETRTEATWKLMVGPAGFEATTSGKSSITQRRWSLWEAQKAWTT
jgi:hypothetical protein